MTSAWLLVLVVFLSPTVVAQNLPGVRIDLTSTLNLGTGATRQFAQLFVPEYFVATEEGDLTLVVHLHGASAAAEKAVYAAGVNAILINIHLGPLSSPYRSYFSEQSAFGLILDTVLSILQSNNIVERARISRLIVSSFSAGYGGVREILKSRSYVDRMDALILADGLHSDSDAEIMNVQMNDFLLFAKSAVGKRKVFILTHSRIATQGYESTTSTASYLLERIGLRRLPDDTTDEIGTLYSLTEAGFFRVYGYSGESASDHMKHLHGLSLLIRQAMTLTDSITVGTAD